MKLAPDNGRMDNFQHATTRWMRGTFTPGTVSNERERAYRFLEEALELFQAMDLGVNDAFHLVDYVFNRPKGEAAQEVGGVMITLAALCSAKGIGLEREALKELARVQSPEVLAKIRAKRASRAVPGDYAGESS